MYIVFRCGPLSQPTPVLCPCLQQPATPGVRACFDKGGDGGADCYKHTPWKVVTIASSVSHSSRSCSEGQSNE